MIDLAARQKLIHDFPCFKKLTEKEVFLLARMAEEVDFDAGTVIVKQNDPVDSVYLIFSGIAEVFVKPKEETYLNEDVLASTLLDGESIGLNEFGFFSKSGFRTATVIAKTKIELLKITLQNFHQFLTQHPHFAKVLETSSREIILLQLMKKILPFQKISDKKMQWMLEKIEVVKYKKDDLIFSNGDAGDFCYFIESGKVEIFIPEEQSKENQIAVLGKSSFFGEMSVISGTPRIASARALEDCVFIRVGKDTMSELVFSESDFAESISQTIMERARPIINKNVIIHHNQSDENDPIVTLKNETQDTYQKLNRQGWFVYQQLNGKNTLNQIAHAFEKEFKSESPDFIYNLIVELIKGGFAFYTTEKKAEESKVNFLYLDSKNIVEQVFTKFKDFPKANKKSKLTWLHVSGLTNVSLIQEICNHYHIHPLTVRDIFNVDQRSKIEQFEKYTYVSIKLMYFDTEKKKISLENVSLILSHDHLITFQESETLSLNAIIKSHLHSKSGKKFLEKGTDYLAYRLIDAVIEQYFSLIEIMNENLEHLEELVLSEPTQKNSRQIYELKRQMFILRKTIWPVRETVSQLQHINPDLISDYSKVHFKDLYDHTAQAMDSLSLFRDRLVGLLDIYLSSLSNRMNEVMKVLTVIATTFIPITCLATILGMNFDHMTIYHWYWGYPLSIGIMLLMTFGMLGFFRWKKWI